MAMTAISTSRADGHSGALRAVYTFLIAPLRDYMRIRCARRRLSRDFFMMVVLFTALNAFLESFSSTA